MGTTVEPSQIGKNASVKKSKKVSTAKKSSGKLNAAKTATKTVKGATPEQISAAQNAQAAYGKAAVAINNGASKPAAQAAATAAKPAAESAAQAAATTAKPAAKGAAEAATSAATDAGKDAAKTGAFKRIGNFFSENGKKVSEFTKTKIWEPVKRNPKTAAAVLAITAIIGGTIYAMSGDKTPKEEQIDTEIV